MEAHSKFPPKGRPGERFLVQKSISHQLVGGYEFKVLNSNSTVERSVANEA